MPQPHADTKYSAVALNGHKLDGDVDTSHDEHFSFKQWVGKHKKKMTTSRYWTKKFPIIGWLRIYNTSVFVSDLIAGLTVGLTVIPQGMACAVVAGLPPQYGLYSAFIPCFIYMFLGTSKDITIGPTAISAMLIKPYVDQFGADAAVLMCFVCGCLISVMGIFKLGFMVDFISLPVVSGFISAGAIGIASSQVSSLLGFKKEGSQFLEYWYSIFKNIRQITLWDTLLGFTCIGVLLVLKHIAKFSKGKDRMSVTEKIWRGSLRYVSLGRNALVVVICTLMIALLMDEENPVVRITGPLQEGFPEFGSPKFYLIYNNETLSAGDTVAELSSSIIMSFVLILESIAIAKAFAKGKTIDATQEMLALGLSNLIGSFFQSFPVTGSFTRTAVNNASGVKTPVGGIYTGTLVIICLLFLTSYLKYIPKATLSAVVICAVISMVEIHETTKLLWKSRKFELIPLYATFIGCLILGLDIGILIGVAINMMFILYEAARPKMKLQQLKVLSHDVLLVSPDRSITYPAAEYVKEFVTKASLKAHRDLMIVVDGRAVHNVDSTAVKVLKTLIEDMKSINRSIVFWNWSRTNTKIFTQFDNKNMEVFKNHNSIEELVREEHPDAIKQDIVKLPDFTNLQNELNKKLAVP